MTASLTIRATELFCLSANTWSRSCSPVSKREWIGMRAGFFGDRRIMHYYDLILTLISNNMLSSYRGASAKSCAFDVLGTRRPASRTALDRSASGNPGGIVSPASRSIVNSEKSTEPIVA